MPKTFWSEQYADEPAATRYESLRKERDEEFMCGSGIDDEIDVAWSRLTAEERFALRQRGVARKMFLVYTTEIEHYQLPSGGPNTCPHHASCPAASRAMGVLRHLGLFLTRKEAEAARATSGRSDLLIDEIEVL
jgi:hypothetical protein